MSFDFAVWDLPKVGSTKEANEIYRQLCDGDCSSVQASTKVDSFLKELTAVYPQIDDYSDEDVDDCPWSTAFDVSPGHAIMCCVWSRVDEIEKLVKQLAAKHALICYDPQSDAVTS